MFLRRRISSLVLAPYTCSIVRADLSFTLRQEVLSSMNFTFTQHRLSRTSQIEPVSLGALLAPGRSLDGERFFDEPLGRGDQLRHALLGFREDRVASAGQARPLPGDRGGPGWGRGPPRQA